MSQQVSNDYYQALQNSHQVAVQFEILTPNAANVLYQSPVYIDPGGDRSTISTTGGTPYPTITGGNVTMQKQADQRTQCTMELYDPTGELASSGILSPFGNEIRIYRGIAYGSEGPFEMFRLGTLRITDVEQDDQGHGVKITIQGQDRSRIVSRVKVPYFYQTASNQAYSDAIRAAVTSCYPSVVFNDTAAAWYTVPPSGIGLENGTNPQMIDTPTIYGITFQQGDDLWTESRNMAASLSCDLYFNRDGICTLVMDPNMNYMNGSLPTIPAPVYEFIEGETCTFTGVKQKFSDADAYNQWVITGEGQIIGYTQAPIQNHPPAADNDPTSPTYIFGPYGVVTGFQTNQLLVTQGQVNSYANFMLATSTGRLQTVTLTAFVDAALDIDDPIMITRAGVGLVNQLFIIDSLQIPLTVTELMQITTRERRAFIYGQV